MVFFFFNDTATTEIYTLSLHDALPISADYDGDGRTDIAVFRPSSGTWYVRNISVVSWGGAPGDVPVARDYDGDGRSEEHTSELQSRQYLVCRPLLEKKNHRQPTDAQVG